MYSAVLLLYLNEQGVTEGVRALIKSEMTTGCCGKRQGLQGSVLAEGFH